MSAAAAISPALDARRLGPAADPDGPIRRVAEQIEGLFLREVLKVMRDSVPESGMLQGGLAGNFYGDMLDEELTSRAGQAGGLGLADVIAQQLGARPAMPAAPGFAPLAPSLAAARYRDAATQPWVHPLPGRPALPRGDGARFGASRSGGTRAHMGVDLAAPVGTPVRAVGGGIIEKIELDAQSGRAGRYVRIGHPGNVVSRYIHLDEVRADLAPGESVAAGEVIGTVGRTGVRHSGTHLHFTLSQRTGGPGTPESYIDPEAWLAAWSQGIPVPPPNEPSAGRAESARDLRSRPQIAPSFDDNQLKGGP